MTYTLASPTMGVPDITAAPVAGAVGTPAGISQLPSVTTANELGQTVQAWDATLGQATFQMLAIPAGTTVTAGLLYQFDKNYKVTVVPAGSTSKNTGVAVALAYTSVASNASSTQYAWFLVQGTAPALKTAVQVAPAQPIYISATAGRVKILSSSGQSILGGRTQNTATVTATTSYVNVYLNFSALEGA